MYLHPYKKDFTEKGPKKRGSPNFPKIRKEFSISEKNFSVENKGRFGRIIIFVAQLSGIKIQKEFAKKG